jgi:ADP-ribose pyrophosphatase
LPAGLLDVPGEQPLEAARRELAEEADLVASGWEPLVSSWTTPGGNDEIIHLFLATGVSAASAAHDREDEEADIRLAWVPLDDAVAAVLDGRMRNGILTIGVLAAAQRLRDRG